MDALRERGSWLGAAVAAAFALIVVLAGSVAAIPVPLYLTEGCPGDYCFPNIPRVPVVPLLAGIVVVALTRAGGGRAAIIGGGILLGVAAALYAGLIVVSAVPFADPYFTAPYRGYALLYVAIVSAALVAWAVSRGSHPGWRWLGWPLLAVIGVALVVALARRELPTAAAAGVGSLAGLAVALLVARAPRTARTSRLRVDPAVLGIALVAFGFRALFGLQTLFRSVSPQEFATSSDDGDSYFALATRLADDPGMLRDTLAGLAFPPGYTTFIAAVFAPTGNSLAAVVLVQALLGALMAVLVYSITARIAGRAAALLAAVFVALDMNLIQLGSTLTAEAVLLPVSVATVWTLVLYRSSGRARWLLAGAALLGYAFVTRNLVALPLIVATMIWLAAWRRPFARTFRDLAVVAAAILLFASPIAIATAAKDGTPRLTTQLAGLAWDFDGGVGYTVSNKELVALGIRPFDDPRGSLAAVMRDPAAVVRFYANAVPQRLSTLLFKAPVGLSDPLLIVNPAIYPNAFDAMTRILRILGVIVVAVAVIRTRLWRRYPEITLMAMFVVLYVAAFSFVFAPYHAFRYRAPIEPFRFIAEAAGVWLMIVWALASVRALRTPARAPAAT